MHKASALRQIGESNGTAEFLVLSELKIDRRYQRCLDERRIESIAKVWDPKRAKPPIVSRRTDGDYIIDGQHTAWSGILANGERYALLCIVYTGLSPQREAEIFDGQHIGVRRLTRVDLYHSRVFRREPVATAIDSIVLGCGLRVSAQAGKHTINAIAALERAHKAHKNLEATLRVLKGWGDSRGGAFNGYLIKSVSCFLDRYAKDNVNAGRLVERLRATTPVQLLAQISVKYSTDGGSMEACGAKYLRTIYNQRLRVGKLPRFNGSDE